MANRNVRRRGSFGVKRNKVNKVLLNYSNDSGIYLTPYTRKRVGNNISWIDLALGLNWHDSRCPVSQTFTFNISERIRAKLIIL